MAKRKNLTVGTQVVVKYNQDVSGEGSTGKVIDVENADYGGELVILVQLGNGNTYWYPTRALKLANKE